MKIRPAFTLFELILAIALSVTLLALIGTAINLYLVRMDTGRTRVEEAQLARSILSTIAADVRATTVYQTQDISAVKQLAKSAKPFDPDAIDQSGTFGASAIESSSGDGTDSSPTSSDSASSSSSSAGAGLLSDSQLSTTTDPGLNGLEAELMLDVARLPRLDELYPAAPPSTSTMAVAATTGATRPSDLKTVRYFIHQGAAIDPSVRAATLLSPDAQQDAGGLVRQSVDRAIWRVAEQSADAQLLNSGQVLLAPEVTQLQFVYFDGTTAYDNWDMREHSALPTAIEVRIWIAPEGTEADSSSIPVEPRMYSQSIELPLAQAAGTSTSTSDNAQSTDDTESGFSDTEDAGDFGSTSQE